MSRTIDQIIDDIKFQFKDTVLENAANNKGNLYSLIRGMAIASFNQERVVENLINTRIITSATGLDLDIYANSYGIKRREGTSSFGSVIVKSNQQLSIPSNTIIQTQDGLLTFQTTKSIQVSPDKEVTIPIVSNTKTFEANLLSGNQLICLFFPSLFVQIGNFRDANNNIIGSLAGGSSSESDINLRDRLNTFINNKGLVTLTAIKAVIQNYVTDIFFVEGRPAAGYTTAYINTSDQLTVDLITNKLNDIKPVGTLIIIKPIQYQRIDLIIDVIINSNTVDTITSINSNVRLAINSYFSNLTIGETLVMNELSSFVTSFTGYTNRIVKPTSDIKPLISEYLLLPNEVTINVKSR